MRNTTWTPALSVLGIALLVSSCTGAASAGDDESEPRSGEDSDRVAVTQGAEGEPQGEWEDPSVPFSEEHLGEGVDMPDGCLEEPMYVEPDMVFDEVDLAHMCPIEPAADRVFRPSQQIIGMDGSVEIRYLDGEDGAGVEVHHLHCDDADALAEKEAHNGANQPAGWPQEWDGAGAMPDPYCHPDYLEIGEWEHLEAFSSVWEGKQTSTLGDYGQPQDEINKFLWEQSQARASWTP